MAQMSDSMAVAGAGEGEVCRTCLSSQALAPLFPKPAQYRSFQLALRLSTGLQMDFNDGLPQYICRICNQTVEALMFFRLQSQAANEALWELFKNKNTIGTNAEQVPTSTENLADTKNESIPVKLENLPTAADIKLDAKNKLAEFYKKKFNIPQMLYFTTAGSSKNLIIEKTQLPKASELIAEQKRLLELYEFKRARKEANEARKRARTSRRSERDKVIIPTVDKALKKRSESSLKKVHTKKRGTQKENGSKDPAESIENVDVKPDIDKMSADDTDDEPLVKSECKSDTEIKTEPKTSKLDSTVIRRNLKRKHDSSDTDDDMSDRDDNISIDNDDSLSETSDTKKYTIEIDTKKKLNVSVGTDSMAETKPVIQIVPIVIQAPKDLKRRNRPQPKKTLTRTRSTKSSGKTRQATKSKSKPIKKQIPTRTKVPVKKIKIVRKEKRRFSDDFRRRCRELIKGPYDEKSQRLQCKTCQHIYKDIYSFERHAQRHLGYVHICDYCHRGFESRDVMMRHIRGKHPEGGEVKKEPVRAPVVKDPKPDEFRQKSLALLQGPYDRKSKNFKCTLCKVTYKDINSFKRHTQRHLGFKNICEYCQRGYTSRHLLVVHVQSKHAKELKENPNSSIPPPKENDIIRGRQRNDFREKCMEIVEGPFDKKNHVQCKICKVVCKNIHSFETHAQIHLGFKHLCEFCAKGFPSQAALKQHLQAFHGLARELSCSFCDYKAIFRNQLKVHEMKFHTKERPFVCEECGSGYYSRSVLTQHIRHSHQTEKPFECDECPRRFKLHRELNYHKKLAHCPTFTFVCHICNTTFKSTWSVRNHYLKIHNIPRDQQVKKIHRLYFDQPQP